MSTPQEIKEHNEKAMRNLERMELVAKFAESIGCTDAQAATISKAYSERFVYDGAVLSFNGKPVIEAAEDVKAHFKTHGLDFLLPAAGDSERPDVNPALLAKVRGDKFKMLDGRKVGDVTAYGQLVRQHGKAVIDALLDAAPAEKSAANGQDKTADSDVAFKGKINPWRPEFWNKTEQGRIAKTLGVAVAERMARAANSTLGATKASTKLS